MDMPSNPGEILQPPHPIAAFIANAIRPDGPALRTLAQDPFRDATNAMEAAAQNRMAGLMMLVAGATRIADAHAKATDQHLDSVGSSLRLAHRASALRLGGPPR